MGIPEPMYLRLIPQRLKLCLEAILVYTLPLWLCRGTLVDFVLNAFALVYIVELDMKEDAEEWEAAESKTKPSSYSC